MAYILLLLAIALAIGTSYWYAQKNKKPFVARSYPLIRPDFKWEDELPRPIRPFQGKKNYKITMAISDISKTPEDWLLIENTYKDITELRRQVSELHPEKVIHVHDSDRAKLGVRELYDWMIEYLLQRYPMYFERTEKGVYNKIHRAYLPNDARSTPAELVKSMAYHIEEDFVMLLKDDPSDKEEEYKLRASLNGAPAGFDPSHGFNKQVSEIHGPVPQYAQRLKFSMHKFFNRLTPQDLWVRHNWGVQTHNNRFSLDGNHSYDGELKQLEYNEIDFENACFLRVERQILTRLPLLGAIVMTVRTYLTPMAQIRAEGLGEKLAISIDGLPEDLSTYKRRGAWGEAVKQYLREER